MDWLLDSSFLSLSLSQYDNDVKGGTIGSGMTTSEKSILSVFLLFY